MTGFSFAMIGIAVGVVVAAVAMGLLRGGEASTTRLERRLEVQAAELRRLADGANVREAASEQLRVEIACARETLRELAQRERERRDQDKEAWDVVRRLSTVLASGSAKGRAGENILREHLAEFPPGMLATDFKVNGKVVEFGLLLPDGRRLPIDSKWSAAAELEALEAAEEPAERDARARDVERVVLQRAKEVAQYLDPSLTAPVAVAAIPDAAYAGLRRAHADAFAKGVVIVPVGGATGALVPVQPRPPLRRRRRRPGLSRRGGDAARRDGERAGEQDCEGLDDDRERGRRVPLPAREGARVRGPQALGRVRFAAGRRL